MATIYDDFPERWLAASHNLVYEPSFSCLHHILYKTITLNRHAGRILIILSLYYDCINMALDYSFPAILGTFLLPWWLTAIIIAFTYVIFTAIYRLYLSPLASIPGPKLAGMSHLTLCKPMCQVLNPSAALTHLYCMYHDIYRGGQYIWVVEDMHKRYGQTFLHGTGIDANTLYRTNCSN